jgi:hypothetical protein
MKVREIYSKNFIHVSHNDSVLYVAKLIREQHGIHPYIVDSKKQAIHIG